MKLQVFQIGEDRTLTAASVMPLSQALKDSRLQFWVDVEDADSNDLANTLSSFDLHPLALEACLDTAPRSGFGAYGDSLVIELPTHVAYDAPRSYLSIVCLRRVVVTIHQRTIPSLKSIATDFSSSMRLHQRNTSSLLYHILDRLIDQGMVLASQSRQEVDSLEDDIDQQDGVEVSGRILGLKRQVSHLGSTAEDQMHCVSALQTVESESFSIEGLEDYFRDALAHLTYAIRSLGRQEDRLAAIHQHNLLKLQDLASKRLRLLTIVSAIFLPLMLITGIYGMNFRYMPELGSPYAYPFVIFVMVVLAAVMLWLFYRKEWFK